MLKLFYVLVLHAFQFFSFFFSFGVSLTGILRKPTAVSLIKWVIALKMISRSV